MGKMDHEIQVLLDEAQRRHACAVASNRRQEDALRYRVGTGQLVSPARGLFARAEYWESLRKRLRERHLHVLRGLQQKHPEWVFCGPSAAVAWNLEVRNDLLAQAHVLHRATGSRRSCGFIRWHPATSLDIEEAVDLASTGVRATAFEQTVADCLRMLDFKDGMTVADSAMRTTGHDKAWLMDVAARTAGHRGARQARLTASHADARAENGGESYARAAMMELGFQLPDLQVEFKDPMSGHIMRVDFLWEMPERRLVAGELDGRIKYEDEQILAGRTSLDAILDERKREARLSRQVEIVRFSFGNVRNTRYFTRLLDEYGIPHVAEPKSYDVRPKARPRCDKRR